jgi:predicted nucleic acid-binding protein
VRLAVLDKNIIVSAGLRPEGASATLVMGLVLDALVQSVASLLLVVEYRTIAARPKFHHCTPG